MKQWPRNVLCCGVCIQSCHAEQINIYNINYLILICRLELNNLRLKARKHADGDRRHTRGKVEILRAAEKKMNSRYDFRASSSLKTCRISEFNPKNLSGTWFLSYLNRTFHLLEHVLVIFCLHKHVSNFPSPKYINCAKEWTCLTAVSKWSLIAFNPWMPNYKKVTRFYSQIALEWRHSDQKL